MTFYSVLLVILVAVLVWKITAVARDPRSVEQWAILVAILGIVAALVLDLPRENPMLDIGFDPRLARLGQNVAIVCAYGALQLFYLRYVTQFLRRPRLGLELIIVGVVLVALVLFTIDIIAVGADMTTSLQNLSNPAVVGFFLTGGLYIAYAQGTQLWWTARFSRRPEIADPLIRRAAYGAALGNALSLVAQFIRLAVVLAAVFAGVSLHGIELAPRLVVVGAAVLVVSLVLPVLIRAGARLVMVGREIRAYRQLGPLWEAVAWTYPALIRPTRPTTSPPSPVRVSRSGRRSGSRTGLMLQNRLGQCREGYLRTLPRIISDPATGTAPAMAEPRVAVFAEHLRDTPPVDLDVADPASRGGLPADTSEFTAVSLALRAQGLEWCRRETPTRPDSAIVDQTS